MGFVGFSNSAIDFTPDRIVGLVGEDCAQERLNAVKNEVIGAQKIVAKGTAT
jgi:hypothetical protein